MSNRAAFIESEKGQIIVRDTEIAELEEGEILVKVHAGALQPGDAMVAKLAIVPIDYPAVLGVPIAGVVEALGPGVTKVCVGDRIFCATKILSHKKAKYGGLQRFSIVDAAQAVLVSSSKCRIQRYDLICVIDRQHRLRQSNHTRFVHPSRSTIRNFDLEHALAHHSTHPAPRLRARQEDRDLGWIFSYGIAFNILCETRGIHSHQHSLAAQLRYPQDVRGRLHIRPQ